MKKRRPDWSRSLFRDGWTYSVGVWVSERGAKATPTYSTPTLTVWKKVRGEAVHKTNLNLFDLATLQNLSAQADAYIAKEREREHQRWLQKQEVANSKVVDIGQLAELRKMEA